MILFKYILALLLTIPMGALGLYLSNEYFDIINGKKQARQAAKARKEAERRKARERGFTIHIPDPVIDEAKDNTRR